jgi:Macrocin-O-methyltransferase (TylF)/Glycosyl transferase family 2
MGIPPSVSIWPPWVTPDNTVEFNTQFRETGLDWPKVAHTMVGLRRLENLRDLAQAAIDTGIPGDFIEAGVWRGGCCILMRGVLKANGITDRKVYAADSFGGLPPPSPRFSQDAGDDYSQIKALAVSAEEVRSNFARYGLLDDQIVFVEGLFQDTLPALAAGPFALLRIDGDLYESTYVALESLYSKLSPGGFVIIDDYGGMPPCRQAVEDYRAKAGIDAPIVEIDWTGVFWQKPAGDERHPRLETAETVVAGRLSEAPAPAAKASMPSRSTNANGKARRKPALSVVVVVVVVVYNIPREAPRTLLTLSASYQRHIDADDDEVIVVDNGSKPPLDPALIESLSRNFRLIRIDPAPPSPAHAINRGIAAAEGEVIGVMIDGARMVSPGLLHFARAGAGLYHKAVVVAPGWYLGADYQNCAIPAGYNQAHEDALLQSIKWPEDGYRLFEISTLDQSSILGWLGPLGEASVIFLRREVWEELGGWDERFDVAGGGLLNLDTYYRAIELPGSESVSLLGEGTFHQLHGGVATNSPLSRFIENFGTWHGQYEAIRGHHSSPPCLRLRRPISAPCRGLRSFMCCATRFIRCRCCQRCLANISTASCGRSRPPSREAPRSPPRSSSLPTRRCAPGGGARPRPSRVSPGNAFRTSQSRNECSPSLPLGCRRTMLRRFG